MAVYVDDMYKHPEIATFRGMLMSHMIADNVTELLIMAVAIGMDLKWVQYPENSQRIHFDICMSKRKLAVELGAVEITWRQLGEMVLKRKPNT